MTPALPGVDPAELVSGLVLEDGTAWGDAACPQQAADMRAMLDHRPESVRQHFLTRPRGGSKSTDAAALALAALLAQAPPGTTSHVFASDAEQAGLVHDKALALAQRSGLAGLLTSTRRAITAKGSGARLRVEPADAPGSFGLTPFLVVMDEAAQWPDTDAYRTLRRSILSAMPKRPDSRLVVCTSAGSPGHSSALMLARSRTSRYWRTSEMPGPVPWLPPSGVEAARENLTETEFSRDVLNEWSTGDEMLVDPADLEACTDRSRPAVLDPVPGARYAIGVDGAVTGDRYAVLVCRAEHPGDDPDTPALVSVDRVDVFSGTRQEPIDLAAVGDHIRNLAHRYAATVAADPAHIAETVQRLRADGVRVLADQRNQSSNHRAATNLYRLMRARRVRLPDDPELLRELLTVRLRESGPGLFRLDSPRGTGLGHGDRAAALSYAAVPLVRPEGRASIAAPSAMRVPAKSLDQRSSASAAASGAVTRPYRSGPSPLRGPLRVSRTGAVRGLDALIVPGSANDPRRGGAR